MALKEMIVLAFVGHFLVVSCHGVEEGRRVSRDEDLELDRQLKLLNKPAIKSIETEYGDIFDCVDINKQPALANPLLKDHKVQEPPRTLRKKLLKNKASSSGGEPLNIGLKDGGCPSGTVPIRKTTKEDLLRAKSLSSSTFNLDKESFGLQPGVHVAVKYMNWGNYYGTIATFNVWRPTIAADQYGLATLWLYSNSGSQSANGIQAGWAVAPQLYRDGQPRLTTQWWNVDGSSRNGCFNVLCSGFVQVSKTVPLGIAFSPISVPNGKQYEIPIGVYMERKSNQWWLIQKDFEFIGYWPRTLFTSMREKADMVMWGGQTVTDENVNKTKPQMGSGEFAYQEYRLAAYIDQVGVVNDKYQLVDPDAQCSSFQ